MLNIYFKWRQKIEAQSTQLATNNEQMSYILGSLRTGSLIAILNYLEGSTRLQEIEETGNTDNDLRKDFFPESH